MPLLVRLFVCACAHLPVSVRQSVCVCVSVCLCFVTHKLIPHKLTGPRSSAPTVATDGQDIPVKPVKPDETARQAAYGVWAVSRQIFAEKGVKGFFGGLDARVSRQAPAQGVCLFVFESLKQLFKRKVQLGAIFVAVSDDVVGVKFYRSLYASTPAPPATVTDATAAAADMAGGAQDSATTSGFVSANAGIASVLEDPSVGATAVREGVAPAMQGLDANVAGVVQGIPRIFTTALDVAGDLAGEIGPNLANLDLDLSQQSAAQAAAALSQEVAASTVVPLWHCGGLFVDSDVLESCVNQAVTLF